MHPQSDDFYLLTVLCLGVGGSVMALAGIWLERRLGRRTSRIFGGVLFLVFSILTVALWAAGKPVGVLQPFLALATVCLVACAAHSAIVRWGMQRLLKPMAIWGLLLIMSPIFSLVYAYRINRADALPPLLADPGPQIRVDASFPHAVTDLGREIQLFHFEEIKSPEELEHVLVEGQELTQKVIRIAGPDAACNCHGWVFTGGQYGVSSLDVDKILADNNYQLVPEAGEGDIIVYRDGLGQVQHSGLVRFVGTDGLVLVESKWGPLGLFMHPPKEQPYGERFNFYHSSRPGNELTLAPAAKRRRNSRRGIT